MPESPYFYLMKGNIDEARKSLQQFRGVDDVQEELDRIESALREQNARKGNLLDLFTVRNNRKALMLSLGNNIINRLIMIVKDKLDMQITYCKANAMLFKKKRFSDAPYMRRSRQAEKIAGRSLCHGKHTKNVNRWRVGQR